MLLSGSLPLLLCPIIIETHFFYKGQRPDLSGACESIGDCLQGIVYADDRQIESWDGSRCIHDLQNPRTEVIIGKYDPVSFRHAGGAL